MVPSNLYGNTGIVNERNGSFTKALTVRGIKLLGGSNISNSFMRKVGQIIEEMFDRNASGIDAAQQEAIIRTMYQRKTAIPIFKGSSPNMDGMEALESTYSICDIIMEFAPSS